MEKIFAVATALLVAVDAIVVQPNKNERVQVEGPAQALPRPPPGAPFPPNLPPNLGSLLPAPSITVELTEDSGRALYQLPGSVSWIHFEVTNRRDFPMFLEFMATDDKGYARDVRPKFGELPPGRSMRVDMLLKISYSEAMGTTDRLTLLVQGGGPDQIATRSALLRVGTQEPDDWAPSCSSKITRNCGESLDTWKCQTAIWSAEATLKDDQSGLLKVSAQPPFGFRYGTFYAGTRDEVKVFYEASCCEKEVVITGVDLQGNYGRCKINVAGVLTTGEIIAIALGVLLLIAIIVIIITVVVICRRRTRRSLNIKL